MEPEPCNYFIGMGIILLKTIFASLGQIMLPQTLLLIGMQIGASSVKVSQKLKMELFNLS